MMAHVELAAPDLPWRYSPVAHTPGMTGLRPWLVLVVGTPSEVTLLADGRVRLSGASLFDAHPLAGSHRWAHVHEVPGRKFSRIVSPRSLVTGQNYLAVLVPAWRAVVAPDGSSSLVDSWPTASGTVTLPCFDRWTFRTTEDPGDFAAVAKRLEPLSDAEATVLAQRSFGRAQVTVGPVPDTTLATGGALVSVPPPGAAAINEPLLAPIAQVIEPLAANLSDGDRWVLSLPRYDAPWHPGPVDGEEWQWPPPGDDVVPDGWRRQLRVDPGIAERPGSAPGLASPGKTGSLARRQIKRPRWPPRPSESANSTSGWGRPGRCGTGVCQPSRWPDWPRSHRCLRDFRLPAAAAHSRP